MTSGAEHWIAPRSSLRPLLPESGLRVEATLSLNDAQRRAVEHRGGALLVVAGAGSGKTRVLAARVARLLADGVRPEAVLAFTFTNRAAREMRERIERSVGEAARRLWVGTFHATAVRILRREAAAAGIPPAFAIYDREDQEGLLREIVKRLELPEAAFRLGPLIARIADSKNALVTPDQAARAAVSPYEKQVAECYRLYQRQLRENGALDFDDLIAELVRLLLGDPGVAKRYAARFEHVLVDEYQDTNHAQFRLVERLSRVHGNLFVVGGDDQSIYGWRGADLANVLEFETAFPGAEVIRLEQNYRSTRLILEAANAVIAHNRGRRAKTLWSEREEGPRLRFVLAADEVDEARRITAFLDERRRRGGRLDECAVLYRTNAQSRALEIELRARSTPYEIVGGVSFYQRREVKDLLAYLRLVANPRDGAAFWRVWNTPRRGRGPAVRGLVEARIERDGAPVEALRALEAGGTLTRVARAGAGAFLGILDDLGRHRDAPPDRLLLRLLERSEYFKTLESDGAAADDDRRANIEELIAAGARVAAAGGGLLEFLAESSLTTDADRLAEGADRVLLLTAHNAKGLEFPAVVIAGLEEGLFPHANAFEDPARMEEERRLFYVALTRAADEVLLTAAAYRRRFDGARGGRVSRFVEEIPSTLLDAEELVTARAAEGEAAHWGGDGLRRAGSGARSASRAPAPTRADPHHRAVGREVFHESFGRGVVVAAEGEGGAAKFTVRFGGSVRKVLGRFLTGGDDGH